MQSSTLWTAVRCYQFVLSTAFSSMLTMARTCQHKRALIVGQVPLSLLPGLLTRVNRELEISMLIDKKQTLQRSLSFIKQFQKRINKQEGWYQNNVKLNLIEGQGLNKAVQSLDYDLIFFNFAFQENPALASRILQVAQSKTHLKLVGVTLADPSSWTLEVEGKDEHKAVAVGPLFESWRRGFTWEQQLFIPNIETKDQAMPSIKAKFWIATKESFVDVTKP